jgi:cobalt-zinc-cadmium efflux system outer membrane protein
MALPSSIPRNMRSTTLVDSAYHNRTDLQIARTNTKINQLNTIIRKPWLYPTSHFRLAMMRPAASSTGYYGIGASIDLPFFNRNQGNIKNAKIL